MEVSFGWGRFTIPAESCYSPDEGEVLAVATRLESSRYYTLGCRQLYVGTDHKPLLAILVGGNVGKKIKM